MKNLKLRNIRIDKGYRQREIAEILHTDVSNYSQKENGEIVIYKEEWEKIAVFLDVPLDDIYEPDRKYQRRKLTKKDYVIILEDQNLLLKTELGKIKSQMEIMKTEIEKILDSM
ncbi:hypothetical protein BAS06_06730 [Elizabethkingia miricola]|uniref:helix-turn-helix domain-containing protein n=1 Tax=Weeksellaceae TaxID=2762318 RepID=UPI00099A461B|nr:MULTISPECIES: helix-turn-helix transcriptional regulator [Weeksellaceae]MDV3492908.1 XRE family transcriptional regulator [Elizabethkingia anophelis]MDV4129621.1 XRE family transcriptional regulator [Elizabethkingia anophelis]MDV4133309.1 XRE family transcriptional regulator [Elizabethkingia anophelis]OPB90029.1 hypothetical protein BAS06_06730 [Elizabethkingia miricola]OPC56147.1 hypothetical protein BAY08_05175 [Elizabethkingia anophelis]